MKHLKLFEAHKNSKVEELLDGISPEFWKMVKVADWSNAIEEYNKLDYKYNEILDDVRCRVYKEYTFDEVRNFEKIYDDLYKKVYDYFDPHYDMIDPPGSDDSWTDFLSSIIGRGEKFLIKSIDNPYILKGKKYMENFRYILQVDHNEYDKIKNRIFYKEVDKYNL